MEAVINLHAAIYTRVRDWCRQMFVRDWCRCKRLVCTNVVGAGKGGWRRTQVVGADTRDGGCHKWLVQTKVGGHKCLWRTKAFGMGKGGCGRQKWLFGGGEDKCQLFGLLECTQVFSKILCEFHLIPWEEKVQSP